MATLPTSFADFEADPSAARTAARESRVETKPAATEVEISEEEPAPSGTKTQQSEPAPNGEVKAKTRDTRIQELIAERKARDEKLAALEARLEAFERGQKQAPAEVKTEVAKAADTDPKPVRPRLSKFDGTLDEFDAANDKYEDDMDAWRDRQGKKQQQANQQQTSEDRKVEAYKERARAHIKTHPDYDAKIADLAKRSMTPTMYGAVIHVGPELGQALIDNPAEALRISQLPADEQIFALGQLSKAGAPAAASKTDDDEDFELDEDTQPAKIPARVGTGGGVPLKPENAKNFAQFEAAKERLKTKRR